MKRLFASFLAIWMLCLPFGGLAATSTNETASTTDAGFDANRVLEDDDIFNINGMSYNQLVSFLRSKGTLADTIVTDIDGVKKNVPDIIWRVATSYKINPKYLLALIQKEQSLVEDPDPSQAQFDWAAGYAICDSCSKDDPSVQEFKGFASQIEWAAKQHREKYLLQILGTGTTRAGKAPGKQMSIDNQLITPANNATAMLYAYTPHIHGNLNLWRIWQRWFSLSYPDGTRVHAKPSDTFYLIRLGQKKLFTSRAVFESLADPTKVISVSDTNLAAYPDGTPIQFPKFALVQDREKAVWLLTGDGKRKIDSMKTFRKFGFNEDEIIPLDADDDIADYAVGKPITAKTQFPQGIVMRSSADKALWYVEDSERHLITDPVFLKIYFKDRQIKNVGPKTLATYTISDPYRLHEGELVRAVKDPSVFVVENGVLRPIPSADTFEGLGWKWTNVVTISDTLLKTYTIGDPVGITTKLASL